MQKAACLFARGEGRQCRSGDSCESGENANEEGALPSEIAAPKASARTIKKRAKERQPANVERQVLAVVLYVNTMPSLYISAKRYYCHGAWSEDVWTKRYSVG